MLALVVIFSTTLQFFARADQRVRFPRTMNVSSYAEPRNEFANTAAFLKVFMQRFRRPRPVRTTNNEPDCKCIASKHLQVDPGENSDPLYYGGDSFNAWYKYQKLRRLSVHRAVEQQLVSDLLSDYRREGRPVLNPNTSVVVNISFTLQQIANLDERTQMLITRGWMDVKWRDELLVWDPNDYQGTNRISLYPGSIWIPDMAVGNRVCFSYKKSVPTAVSFVQRRHRLDRRRGGGATHSHKCASSPCNAFNKDSIGSVFQRAHEEIRITVDNTGQIFWWPGGLFHTACNVEIFYYPFDDQKCSLILVGWTYFENAVMLTNQSDRIVMTEYTVNGEWSVLNTASWRYSREYPNGWTPEVYFDFYLRRKVSFILINILLPCVMISALNLIVFFLPPDSGEKIALGTTVLLAFTVFLLLIAEIVPKTSDTVPIITIYLTSLMVMTTVSVICSVLVLRVHFSHDRMSISALFYRFVINWLAPVVLCSSRHKGKFFKNFDKHTATIGQIWVNPDTSDTAVVDSTEDGQGALCSPVRVYVPRHWSRIKQGLRDESIARKDEVLMNQLSLITENGAPLGGSRRWRPAAPPLGREPPGYTALVSGERFIARNGEEVNPPSLTACRGSVPMTRCVSTGSSTTDKYTTWVPLAGQRRVDSSTTDEARTRHVRLSGRCARSSLKRRPNNTSAEETEFMVAPINTSAQPECGKASVPTTPVRDPRRMRRQKSMSPEFYESDQQLKRGGSAVERVAARHYLDSTGTLRRATVDLMPSTSHCHADEINFKFAALVLDRLLLYCFLVIMAGIAIGLLVVLPALKAEPKVEFVPMFPDHALNNSM